MIRYIGSLIGVRLSWLLRIGLLMGGSALRSFVASRIVTLGISSPLG